MPKEAVMLRGASRYHAHLYFLPEQADSVRDLHRSAERDLGAIATLWPMRMQPVGPPPPPMFEIEFPHASRDRVLDWLHAHRGPFPVLLHPETDDPKRDHRDDAVWLGQRLDLNLAALEP
jgi:DOPA 4,5-dioxygenase